MALAYMALPYVALPYLALPFMAFLYMALMEIDLETKVIFLKKKLFTKVIYDEELIAFWEELHCRDEIYNV